MRRLDAVRVRPDVAELAVRRTGGRLVRVRFSAAGQPHCLSPLWAVFTEFGPRVQELASLLGALRLDVGETATGEEVVEALNFVPSDRYALVDLREREWDCHVTWELCNFRADFMPLRKLVLNG